MEHVPWRRHSTLQLLSHLSPAELRAVYSVPAASNADDLKLFARYQLITNADVFEYFLFYALLHRGAVRINNNNNSNINNNGFV